LQLSYLVLPADGVKGEPQGGGPVPLEHRLNRSLAERDRQPKIFEAKTPLHFKNLAEVLKHGMIKARYSIVPYKMNPGVPRECSICGVTFVAEIANALTCSAPCAAHRKLLLQRARRAARSADGFVHHSLHHFA
jgi:hypothetical protein